MENRHYHVPQTSKMGRTRSWNHPHPDPRIHFENGSFRLPADAAANTALRPTDYPSSGFNSEFPSYTLPNQGPVNGPYLPSSSTVNSGPVLLNQAQHVPPPPCYHQLTIRDGSSMLTHNHQTDIGRAGSKRKQPATPLVFDRGNTSGYYCAGSSSNSHISSDHLQPKPMPGPQYWSLGPTSTLTSHRSDYHSTSGEGSQRNVRSRHSNALHLEINPTGPQNFHSTGNISGLTISGQWSHATVPVLPHRRIISPDVPFNYGTNQSMAGSVVTSGSLGVDEAYHSNQTESRNQTVVFPTFHGPSIQSMGAAHSSYTQRSTPYMVNSNLPPMGFAASSSEDGGRSGAESVAPSRNSRPVSIIGRSSNRNGRSRNSYGRSRSSYDEDSARRRWLSEVAVVMDRSAFYDSGDLFDHHRDMRLDIDNMSYEELLALEERIGSVNTGLHEDSISGCLMETKYCLPDHTQDDQEEGKCVICLEEYEDEDNLGRLKCGHDFHAGCIKNWLLIKNVCPICKADALKDPWKEEKL